MHEQSVGDYLDENDIVAEIIMLRAADNKTILILEGETDRKLLSFFTDDTACEIVVGHGRKKVLLAIENVRAQALEGILCVVDSDYDEFLGQCASADDVIVTEEHDIEIILLKSSALEKLLKESGSTRKIKALLNTGSSVLDAISRVGVDLGAMRLHSRRNGDYLKFEGIKLRSLNKRALSCDCNELIGEVLGHSSKPHLSRQPIHDDVEALKGAVPNPFRLCCGHDLTALLGKALQHLIGSQNAADTSPELIEKQLRLGFSWEDFKATRVYDELRSWEKRNAPYAVFGRKISIGA